MLKTNLWLEEAQVWCLFLKHFLHCGEWRFSTDNPQSSQSKEKLLCLTVSLPWQSLLWTKCVCEGRPDFDRHQLVYVRMQIVNICTFWGQYFLCDKNFGVSNCLCLYEWVFGCRCSWCSQGQRKCKYITTCQKMETEWWWERLLRQVL